MNDFQNFEWQPISSLPKIVAAMDGMLEETQEFQVTLSEARGKSHVLDDGTLDRVDRQYRERQEDLDLFAEQLRRWQTLDLTEGQRTSIEALTQEVKAAQTAVDGVLALSAELREGTIDRVMELSDMEMGLMTMLEMTPAQFKALKKRS
ncbi:hypothetical protein [Deinococcus frigens]|uniref:hypothetical protein n=1 Tax=Deinococcus frigens TaxID=249403 RepID=UPI0006911F89|nr:hypothetical protein [Deinococcus frigens]